MGVNISEILKLPPINEQENDKLWINEELK